MSKNHTRGTAKSLRVLFLAITAFVFFDRETWLFFLFAIVANKHI